MSKKQKLLEKILGKPKDLRFEELERIILWCGYTYDRTKGSHAHYFRDGYPTLTIPIKSPVLSYLIKQVLDAVEDDIEDML